jgi:uncharacterized protein
MFGILNTEEIEDLINTQLVGRLGCHADGLTYVVPISYAYDGESVYSLGFEGQKMDMMRRNPSVCFQVDNTNNLDNWQSVIAWGQFEELKDPNMRSEALKKLNQRKLPVIISERMHLTDQWPFVPENFDDIKGIVYRIHLTKKTGRYEKTIPGSFFAT